MKKYIQYDEEDFAWDEPFRQWVLSPTRENDAYWQQWMVKHPEKTVVIQQARSLVQALRLDEAPLSEEEIKYTVQRTTNQIRKTQLPALRHQESRPRPIPIYQQTWFRLAALLFLVSGIGLGLWTMQGDSLLGQGGQLISYNELVERKTLTEIINPSEKPMPVKLSDGSLIILKKNSRISYAPSFTGSQREVYLSGEGFFEVTKNPDKPFLIYANGLVTKVLGTSFSIKAYPADRNVTVEVKTGRVAVFTQSDPRIKEKAGSRELEGVLLTPNQKIVYVRDEVRLTKSLVDTPQVIVESPAKPRFTFEETPVPAVFDALEKAYEVDIVYDEQLLANCPLTATLADQPLFEKLDIICRVIEARYEIMDGHIVIHSQGCKP